MNDLAIEITWAIGLVGILIPTVFLLNEVAMILRELRTIKKLGVSTLDAARGIKNNLMALEKLPLLKEPVVAVRDATGSIADTAETLVARLPLRG